jgi:signal transduction histidine kinase
MHCQRDTIAPAEAARALSPAARLYASQMARALMPHAAELEAAFRDRLGGLACGPREIEAFLALTPVAAARFVRRRGIEAFLSQAAGAGKLLALLNVPLSQVLDTLRDFGGEADRALEGRFQPAREQLHFAVAMTLHAAYHEVCETEGQALFGLYEAEADAADFVDLLRRGVKVLTRVFHARSARMIFAPEASLDRLARPLYLERGDAGAAEAVHPELRRAGRSWWSCPVRVEGKTAAVMQFAFAAKVPWTPRELALMEAAAARCGRAVERARMSERLAGRERALRQLAAEAHRAEEEERRRIGRELHDETAQSLLLLKLKLEMLERRAPANLAPELAEARAGVERNLLELRRIIAALGPAVLERLGLRSALKQLGARFRRESDAALSVRIAPTVDRLPETAQQVVYRVAQESLQNAARHSGARNVNLSVSLADRKVSVSVVDDGAGFDADAALSQRNSFGLAGMRERAALLGGDLEILGEPGRGCTVKLKLPFDTGVVGANGKNSRNAD